MIMPTIKFVGFVVGLLPCMVLAQGIHFPPPGETLDKQNRRSPAEVGMKAEVIEQLKGKAARWALWRHGYWRRSRHTG